MKNGSYIGILTGITVGGMYWLGYAGSGAFFLLFLLGIFIPLAINLNALGAGPEASYAAAITTMAILGYGAGLQEAFFLGLDFLAVHILARTLMVPQRDEKGALHWYPEALLGRWILAAQGLIIALSLTFDWAFDLNTFTHFYEQLVEIFRQGQQNASPRAAELEVLISESGERAFTHIIHAIMVYIQVVGSAIYLFGAAFLLKQFNYLGRPALSIEGLRFDTSAFYLLLLGVLLCYSFPLSLIGYFGSGLIGLSAGAAALQVLAYLHMIVKTVPPLRFWLVPMYFLFFLFLPFGWFVICGIGYINIAFRHFKGGASAGCGK